jgi:iron(III) transport system ATP-binding protein
MAQVRIDHVTKSFDQTAAVREVSITVKDGELVTFLGPSGCGKTTTLRMVAGFVRPTAGRIWIGERLVCDGERGAFVPPERRGVGMVFQSYAVWPHMTVSDNVAYPLKVKRVSRAELRRRVEETLHLIKMPDLAGRYPHQLSGGQQQRVALARALVMDPHVLLLDEPLSNLDAKLREEMRIELKALQRQTGATIIFVTHDQVEAMALADRVMVMNAGEVQQIGTPQEIYQNPASRFVADFIGVANFLPCFVDGNGLHPTTQPEAALPPPDSSTGNGRLTLMVRPEDITLDRNRGPVAGVIDGRMYLGNAIEYVVRVGDHLVRAKAPPRTEFGLGDRVRLTFDAYHVFAA